MALFIRILFLIVGFVLLIKGADAFVDGASDFARRFKIPPLVIGMTIVAFGTSAPEAAVSIAAGIKGSNDIAISNVIGSNIFNLLMVAGICALYKPLPVHKIAIERDFPFSILIVIALAALCLDRSSGAEAMMISRSNGIILLLFFCIFMYFNVKDGLNGTPPMIEEEKERRLWISTLLLVFGLAGIILGGQLVVDCSKFIARAAGVSETVIGLTVVALGTSLPELVTSIVAARKGETDIAVGNVIGSNVFNILFVLGLASVVRPMLVGMDAIYDMLVFIVLALIVYMSSLFTKKINRPMGIFMVLCYAAYMFYIFMR